MLINFYWGVQDIVSPGALNCGLRDGSAFIFYSEAQTTLREHVPENLVIEVLQVSNH
jgi:hypothetical protein